MKKTIFILYWLLATFNIAYSQSILKTKEYAVGEEVFIETKEVMIVDTTIKHGLFSIIRKSKKWNNTTLKMEENLEMKINGRYENNEKTGFWSSTNAVLKEEGIYEDGKRTNEWKEYFSSNVLSGQGYYKDGEKVGKWTYYKFYKFPSEPYVIYDYSTKKVVFSAANCKTEYFIPNSFGVRGYTEKDTVECDPIFMSGGQEAFAIGSSIKITYDMSSDNHDILMNTIVKANGSVYHQVWRVRNDENCAVEMAIKQILADLPRNWIPAVDKHGKYVDSVVFQKISFSIE
jgi:hypothetical protein